MSAEGWAIRLPRAPSPGVQHSAGGLHLCTYREQKRPYWSPTIAPFVPWSSNPALWGHKSEYLASYCIWFIQTSLKVNMQSRACMSTSLMHGKNQNHDIVSLKLKPPLSRQSESRTGQMSCSWSEHQLLTALIWLLDLDLDLFLCSVTGHVDTNKL